MGYGAKCFRVSWQSGSPVQQIISGAYAAEALLREQKRPRRHCSCATYTDVTKYIVQFSIVLLFCKIGIYQLPRAFRRSEK